MSYLTASAHSNMQNIDIVISSRPATGAAISQGGPFAKQLQCFR